MIRRMGHEHQLTGKTCGPACINMVYNFLNGTNTNIEFYIAKYVGTNNRGTIDTEMAQGLEWLGIRFKFPREDTTEYLAKILENNVIILRTLTYGIKHWIVLYDYDNVSKRFLVNDPWLGQIKYTHKEVYDIWSVRNFDFFEIPVNQKPKDIEELSIT